jgi:hypothetical protein
MVAMSSAVAGIDPVEPATISGRSGRSRLRRRASASSRAPRRRAGSLAWRSSRILGQFSLAIATKRRVIAK